MIDVLYQATAFASLVTFSVAGLVLRRWLGQIEHRRQERRR